jgi:2-keto-4-pentenoate hydratase
MKTTEKASLIGVVSGVAAGSALAYFVPEAHWGVYLAAGLIVMGGAYTGITQQAATDRIADGDLPAKDKG